MLNDLRESQKRKSLIWGGCLGKQDYSYFNKSHLKAERMKQDLREERRTFGHFYNVDGAYVAYPGPRLPSDLDHHGHRMALSDADDQ